MADSPDFGWAIHSTSYRPPGASRFPPTLDHEPRDESFGELTAAGQRFFKNHTIGVCMGRLPNLDAERELFDVLNFGGLAQGEVDDDV